MNPKIFTRFSTYSTIRPSSTTKVPSNISLKRQNHQPRKKLGITPTDLKNTSKKCQVSPELLAPPLFLCFWATFCLAKLNVLSKQKSFSLNASIILLNRFSHYERNTAANKSFEIQK